ncbi:hypothetical protein AVEN_113594-1, partial [Araneus ventricosus]
MISKTWIICFSNGDCWKFIGIEEVGLHWLLQKGLFSFAVLFSLAKECLGNHKILLNAVHISNVVLENLFLRWGR